MLLYCILDLGYTPESRAEQVTASLLAGGADILQLRAKGHDLATIRRVAEKLIPLCRAAGVPFILNDHPQLAGELGANGVHIGQDDGTLQTAKSAFALGAQSAKRTASEPATAASSLTDRGLQSGFHSFIHSSSSKRGVGVPPAAFIRSSSSKRGVGVPPAAFIRSSSSSPIHDPQSTIPDPSSSPIPDPQSTISSPPIIGRSTHSLDQARAALAEGFDYIGFGPLFPTPTKAGRSAIGLDDIAAMQRDVGDKIPAFCIGGITPETLPQVLAAGARRVVVVSALLQATDIEAATAAIKRAL